MRYIPHQNIISKYLKLGYGAQQRLYSESQNLNFPTYPHKPIIINKQKTKSGIFKHKPRSTIKNNTINIPISTVTCNIFAIQIPQYSSQLTPR